MRNNNFTASLDNTTSEVLLTHCIYFNPTTAIFIIHLALTEFETLQSADEPQAEKEEEKAAFCRTTSSQHHIMV